MNILGERFYNMQTHEPMVFKVPQVAAVMVQPVEVVTVDVETMFEVGTSTIYCVIVMLDDGMFYSTKPLDSEDFATKIATKLADFCKRHAGSN